MDGTTLSISPENLHPRLGTAKSPLLIDVRRAPAFDAADRLIARAVRRLPDDVCRWSEALPAGRYVIAYSVSAWRHRKRGLDENKWLTREHPKIDRIACRCTPGAGCSSKPSKRVEHAAQD